jgi:hypothetical protein
VKKHLFVFCYESPEQLATNPMYGWDDEEAKAVFIRAESEESAWHWGRKAAAAFVRSVFEREEGPLTFEWRPANYMHWIEPDPEARFTSFELECISTIRVGQFLDFAEPQDSLAKRLLPGRRLQEAN